VAPAAGILNEINTIPGFTSIGMYPKVLGARRHPVRRADRLIEMALDRRRKKKETLFTR
jgi:D-alanine-D-alanine ligase